jgi:hypothetical protein
LIIETDFNIIFDLSSTDYLLSPIFLIINDLKLSWEATKVTSIKCCVSIENISSSLQPDRTIVIVIDPATHDPSFVLRESIRRRVE